MVLRLFHRLNRPALMLGRAVLALSIGYLLFVLLGWFWPQIADTAIGNGLLMLVAWTALPAGFLSLIVFFGLMILWWACLLDGFEGYRLIGKAGRLWFGAGVVLVVIGLIVS